MNEKNEEKQKEPLAEESKEENNLESLQRLQAEFENYRKRNDQEKATIIKFANQELIKKILPILDNFELALKNTCNSDDLKKGLELIYSQIIDVLNSEGLKQIKSVGKKFDPFTHEAMMVEEGDKDDIVIEEFQKGYTMNNKVLRHSKVKISRRK